jgi:hypothetical protein
MSIGLAVLFIGILYFAIVNKAFRQITLVGLSVLVIAVLIFFLSLREHETEAKQKRDLAKTFIKPAQVALIDPQVSFDQSDGHPMRITGRIHNGSGYTLEEFEVHLTFQDCAKPIRRGSAPKSEAGPCETVGDLQEEIHIEVPPSQSRDFNEYMSGPILSPRGTIEWSYEVTSTSAQEQ